MNLCLICEIHSSIFMVPGKKITGNIKLFKFIVQKIRCVSDNDILENNLPCFKSQEYFLFIFLKKSCYEKLYF